MDGRELVMRSIFSGVVLAAALVAVSAFQALAGSEARTDGRPELVHEIAAGGLIFSGNTNLAIDQQDVSIGTQAVQVNYVIRNADSSDHTITIAFPFVDVDGHVAAALQSEFDVKASTNYMDAAFVVDGRRPNYAVEQRAIAVGLDVTKAITDAGLPLFPLDADIGQRLADLEPAIRQDLAERGIIRVDDDQITPAWALKSTAYWRQVFPAGQTLALSLSYKPAAGRNAFTSGALQPLKKGVCIDSAVEQAIMRLASEGAPLTMIAVGYVAHPGSEALGPVGRFRLTIDKSEPKSIAATCRQGLSKTSPTTSDWDAAAYATDEDWRVLFVR
jgi:hypothetical protein